MLVVTLSAALIVMTYSAYTDLVRKSRREEAKTFLLDAATRLEQYWGNNKKFTNNLAYLGYAAATDGNFYANPQKQQASWYRITLAHDNGNTATYLLTAIPQRDQANDTKCLNFTLNQIGVRAVSATVPAKDCW